MRVLFLVHEDGADPGVFADPVAARGHELERWSTAWGSPPPQPLESYRALVVLGGAMHVDQEERHPWLVEESGLIRRLLAARVPVFGVCLGGQLLAKAAGAEVARASAPEIGWYEVELLPEAASDPLFAGLPGRLSSFQWHSYRFDLPAGAVPLARSPVCLQAFRLGETAWGLQCHAEVTEEIVGRWLAAYRTDEAAVRAGFDPEAARAETRERIGRWNDVGRELCDRFLAVAEDSAAGPLVPRAGVVRHAR